MLAPPNRIRCIECGLAYGEPGFSLHGGRVESGPAYFTDRGVIVEHGPPKDFFANARDPRTQQFLSQIL